MFIELESFSLFLDDPFFPVRTAVAFFFAIFSRFLLFPLDSGP